MLLIIAMMIFYWSPRQFTNCSDDFNNCNENLKQCKKNNNKLLLAGDKFMPQMHLR